MAELVMCHDHQDREVDYLPCFRVVRGLGEVDYLPCFRVVRGLGEVEYLPCFTFPFALT